MSDSIEGERGDKRDHTEDILIDDGTVLTPPNLHQEERQTRTTKPKAAAALPVVRYTQENCGVYRRTTEST